MKFIAVLGFLFIIFSCKTSTNPNIESLKTGEFKTILDDSGEISFAIRNDSIQIETYKNQKDTFYINWKNNFEYTLLKKNPQNLLDSTPFFVKINKIKNNSYNFKAHHKGSNFIHSGVAIKIEQE